MILSSTDKYFYSFVKKVIDVYNLEKNSIVAIGMIGCKHSKHSFLRGYEAMMSKIEPSTVICFGTPFKEMTGNIVAVDYVSSRKKVR